ncbi:hypothetical protein D3C78_909180 [compost metagenome]
MGLGIGAEEEAVGNRHAVDLGQYALTVDTANVVTIQAAALAGAAHRYAWLVTHQFLDVVDVLAVELLTGLYRDRARHLADVLGAASGSNSDLLQGDGAGAAALEHYIASTERTVFQAGTGEQALQGGLRFQRALHAWRRDAFCQLGRQPDLPAGHRSKGVERRHQRLLANCKAIVTHARGAGLGRLGGQCRQAAGAAGEHGQGQQGERAALQARCTWGV